MQVFFKKSVPGVLALLTLSFAVSVYSDHEVDTTVAHAASHALTVAAPVTHERISRDYAQAHAELMKQFDEASADTF